MFKGNNGGFRMITKTARRLVEIEHRIKAAKELYFGNKISYRSANAVIQDLKDERERLWALE